MNIRFIRAEKSKWTVNEYLFSKVIQNFSSMIKIQEQ
jgi:hypothetical protein